MATDTPSRVPRYRRQKRPDGHDLAFVQVGGRRVYLGAHGTPESLERYSRTVAQWMAGAGPPADGRLSVVELLDRFLRHAVEYYRLPDGAVSPEVDNLKLAIRPVRDLYGRTPAAEFGPLAFKAVRAWMVQRGASRNHVNKQMGRVRHVFRWAVADELVPPAVYQALAAVPGLKRGRSGARETEPVRPVPEADIAAVRPHVADEVWSMVELQLLTGMRPGEAVTMRPVDLDTAGRVWMYRPPRHKNTWRGRDRVVYLGPRAQELVRRFLPGRPVDAYLFDPRLAEARRYAARPTHRHQPTKPARTERTLGPRYTVASYRRSIERACEVAGVTMWGPHRLRHTAATAVRREFGLEGAQVLLGHARADVTQIYAEVDSRKAIEIAERVG